MLLICEKQEVMTNMTSLELANAIADAASDKKAREIVLMNMEKLTPTTD